MSNPYGEPKDGDFVAYIREIEKRQLAAMQRPHAPVTPAQATAANDASRAERKALTAKEAKELVQRLRTGGHTFSTVDVVRLVIGFVLLVAGVFGDGGLIATAIAVVLLWTPVRHIARLLRTAGAVAPAPKDALAVVFGRNAPGSAAPPKAPPSNKH